MRNDYVIMVKVTDGQLVKLFTEGILCLGKTFSQLKDARASETTSDPKKLYDRLDSLINVARLENVDVLLIADGPTKQVHIYLKKKMLGVDTLAGLVIRCSDKPDLKDLRTNITVFTKKEML